MAKRKKNKFQNQKDRLRRILSQLSGDMSDKETELIPEVAIKGEGVLYCYSPSKREFVKIGRGTKAYIINEGVEKTTIYAYTGDIVEIEPDELVFIGFD